MAVFSTISFARLERAKRIDGEYYQPKYLMLGELYKRGQWLPIRKYLDLCEYGISIKMNEDGNGRKIFRMDDLKNGFAFDNEMKYAPIDETTFQKFRLQNNDILFNRVNSEEFVGRTGIFKLKGNYVFASYLVRLRANSKMSPDTINLFLNSKYGVLSIRRLSRRAVNQANVNAQELQCILMPRFSPDFQIALTRYSEHSWELYAEAEQLYTQAEQLLISELGLQNWNPSHTLAYVRNYSQAVHVRRLDAEHFQPKYDEIERYISEYRPQRLSRLATQIIETVKLDEQRKYKYIEISDVNATNGEIGYTEREVKDLPPNAKIKVKGGELIVSKVRPTRGAIGVIPDDCLENGICSSAFVVLDASSPIREFLQVYLRSTIGRTLLEKPCKGTSYPTIDDIDVKALPIPTISTRTQERISELLSQSHLAWREAKALLEKAKRAVEIAIEEGEAKAIEFIQ